jgi:UDP-glucose 4-epimerase
VTSDGRQILVTGANGFVGRHLVPILEREGWNVRRAVRTSSVESQEIVTGSIDGQTDWRAALAGVDIVIHLAARVHHQDGFYSEKIFRDANVHGTLHLARSAATAGVKQFIFLSTVLVHGRSNNGRAPFSERDALTPRGLYGMSKAEAEAGLEALVKQVDMSVTIIRPPLVYGSEAKGHFAQLAAVVKRGFPLPFGSIRNRRAFLSVQNLSSFILHRLSKSERKFDVFLVADREQVSTREFVERMAKAAGATSRLFALPISLLDGALVISGRQEMRYSLIGSLELDLSKVAATGWRAPVGLDEGLRLALAPTGAAWAPQDKRLQENR